ncbi:MAG TPA: sigma-70 family RNA polymerase sigma factor [Verrucomicrobiae bacterium]|nr:sigma-70 family RNA polymerase sigma factor [Verrucomicrobiae bacterium]
MRTEGPTSEPQTHGGVFATTHWSVVLAAGEENALQSAAALEQLCRVYWYPLYSYVRRRGYGHEDAQDLTQGFMLQLLARKSFARADPSRGRFRSFLLAGLTYYLLDQHHRALAQKRGGGQVTLRFVDGQDADARYRLEPMDDSSPDKLFERRWALALLEQVLARLEQEFCAAGKAGLFERLRAHLVANTGEGTYAEAAAALGMTHEGFKKAVQRMRQRYYELFREEIAHTVADAADVQDEMRHLCAVMAG